ncbi:MAG TPA: rod shape-determining protein MreD [Aggregatilineaceae bacterium]|nr:rod shape-determining protein MreD [Aggregatilineaceae bacterium]
MQNYAGIPVLMLAVLLNATLMPVFRLGGGTPDLVFMLVVSWALLADLRSAMVWAIIGGVLQDTLSIVPLGTSALGLVLVVFGSDLVFGQIQRRNILIPPLVAAVGTVIYHVTVLLVLRVVNLPVPLSAGLTYVTLPALIYNTILIIPIFRLVGAVQFWLRPRRVRLE